MPNAPQQKLSVKKKRSRRPKFKPLEIKVSKIYKPDDLELEEWRLLLRKQFAAQQAFNRDEQTGKSHLKIPLPRPEVLEGLFSTFGELLSKFQKGETL